MAWNGGKYTVVPYVSFKHNISINIKTIRKLNCIKIQILCFYNSLILLIQIDETYALSAGSIILNPCFNILILNNYKKVVNKTAQVVFNNCLYIAVLL